MFRIDLPETLLRLWRHPFSSRDDILDFQNRRLRSLIRYAWDRVPYYRQLFEQAGVRPERFRGIEDLPILPVTGKNDLRRAGPENFIAGGYRPDRLVSRATSGSTGRPFVIRRSPMEDHVMNLFRIRQMREYGIRVSDRIAVIQLGPVQGERGRETRLTRLRQQAGIYRQQTVGCLQPLEDILHQLETLDPDVISGYPSTLARVARLARGRFEGRRLRLISCGAESLDARERKTIETGFGVRVFDVFGAHECNLVAWECPKTGLYHVCDDNAVIEVWRDGKPAAEGEAGEIVLTPLHSRAMPLIRYRLGDIAVKGPAACPCGRPFSTFTGLRGRVREYFHLPDGRTVHPLEAILPVFTEKDAWLDQFQMVQESADRFALRITLLAPPPAKELQHLEAEIARRLGPGAAFHIETVDHIPFEASGKFKDCVNRSAGDGSRRR